jgi:hypothetical protein
MDIIKNLPEYDYSAEILKELSNKEVPAVTIMPAGTLFIRETGATGFTNTGSFLDQLEKVGYALVGAVRKQEGTRWKNQFTLVRQEHVFPSNNFGELEKTTALQVMEKLGRLSWRVQAYNNSFAFEGVILPNARSMAFDLMAPSNTPSKRNLLLDNNHVVIK